MWWEILPSTFIVGFMVSVPTIATYFLNPFSCEGRRHHRNIFACQVLNAWYRDERVSGNPYGFKGLESIPDEPTTSSNKK